ncbi:MAG: DUF1499 domain-containing protein [Gemmatimonadales bacterium]
MREILLALREDRADTDPASADARLVGRTYAIPFEHVWNCAVGLAKEGMRGWSVASADDLAGLIIASTATRLLKIRDDVRVKIGLDENGQTRVDVSARSRSERASLGRHRRAIARFLDRLDQRLDARPGQILDATRRPSWVEAR